MKLVFGLPKGSLQESTIKLFRSAGWIINASSRSYYPTVNDPELDFILIRAQEISRYTEQQVLDAGLTGLDWIKENRSDVVEVGELNYAKSGRNPVRWVLAVPEASKFKTVKDLKGKMIATELVNVTKKYLKEKKVKADVEFSWGATEAKPPELADAIVDLVSSGSTLKANNLVEVEEIMSISSRLVVNQAALKVKRDVLQPVIAAIEGAIR